MKSVLLIVFITTFVLTKGQAPNIKKLGVEDGLSNNYVVSITQDKQGFLWFATEEGLNRFDGYKFTAYFKQHTSNNSITGNELNCLHADSTDPIIWIATQRAGLNAYNYRTDSFFVYQHDDKKPESIATNDVTFISPSGNGNLWLSTYHSGVEYLDKKSKTFTHYNKATYPNLPSNSVWTAIEGNNETLYIGHVRDGLSVLNLKNKTLKNFVHKENDPNSLPGNEVKCIFEDKYNNIWIGTNNGLALFNTESEKFYRINCGDDSGGVESDYIYTINQLDDNKLWIAVESNGIYILDLNQFFSLQPHDIKFQHLSAGDNKHNLSNSTIRSFFTDSHKNIWIGTYGGGINVISNTPTLFSTLGYSANIKNTNSLTNKIATCAIYDSKERLWVGTDGDGINVFEAGKRVAVYNKESEKLNDNSVLALHRDSENNIWIGTFKGGVNFYDIKKDKFTAINIGTKNYHDIRCFHENNNNMWIGTSEGIFVVNIKNKNVINSYNTENSNLRENIIRCINQDSKGRFWIGTFGSGVGIYNSEMKNINQFSEYNDFCSNTINHIFVDSQKKIWLATGEGLACFENTDLITFKTYQRENGLLNTYIRAINEDSNGNIWLSTNTGISCFVSKTNKFYNYDHFDELPAGNFMSSSVLKDKNGIIYFGSIDGLCFFNPIPLIDKGQTPTITISELEIMNNTSSQENKQIINIANHNSKTIKLSHEQNTFKIVFNVHNFSLVNQIEYAYLLDGFGSASYTNEKQNTIMFRNIPPGTYNFLLKARIRNQEWTEKPEALKIIISPAWWGSWWAKLIYSIIFMSILITILYFYKKKIEIESSLALEKKSNFQSQELNDERLRFYTNITHELRTPLTLIIGPLEDMIKDTSFTQKQTRKISVIHQSAIRLLNLINQILEFRKTETHNKKLCVYKDDISKLIREIGLKYKELNRNTNIDFEVKIETDKTILFFDKEVITIIIDNLISNAFKYTSNGTIAVSLRTVIIENVQYTEIEVLDTGFGIEEEAIPRIFERYFQGNSSHQVSGTGIGLALVKNLVTLHDGEITVESAVGEGSRFNFRILTDNIYPNALHAEQKTNETTKHKKTTEQSNIPILLVVEDNADIREYIAGSFSETFNVITANDGKAGIDAALENIPDIIVSDIMMPVLNGILMCKTLKEDMRTSHIPIILLTAKDSLQDKEEGYLIGADSYLTKPFSASLLHSRINNLLETRRKIALQLSSSTGLTEKNIALSNSLNRLDNEFILKITTIIEENISSEKIDINYISDKLFMSSSTLYRKMKALTGISTNEFIRKVKLNCAEQLLHDGRYNISEIAYRAGFESTIYFRRCFKEEFGISPSEFVRKIKKDDSNKNK